MPGCHVFRSALLLQAQRGATEFRFAGEFRVGKKTTPPRPRPSATSQMHLCCCFCSGTLQRARHVCENGKSRGGGSPPAPCARAYKYTRGGQRSLPRSRVKLPSSSPAWIYYVQVHANLQEEGGGLGKPQRGTPRCQPPPSMPIPVPGGSYSKWGGGRKRTQRRRRRCYNTPPPQILKGRPTISVQCLKMQQAGAGGGGYCTPSKHATQERRGRRGSASFPAPASNVKAISPPPQAEGGAGLAQTAAPPPTPSPPFAKCQPPRAPFFYLGSQRCSCCSCRRFLPGRGGVLVLLPRSLLPCPARVGGLARRLYCSNEAARLGLPRLGSGALGPQRCRGPEGGARDPGGRAGPSAALQRVSARPCRQSGRRALRK